jgi:S1-C subfamily serine protease
MYPAKLIADYETGDMAILKIELPAAKDLAPIPLAEIGPKIGEDVCAMGWPGDPAENIALALTKGIVSTVSDPHDQEGFIVTDFKVIDGYAGGPLCDFSGSIVGLVTCKSADSNALASPVDRLRKFLLANLPADNRKLPSPQAVTTKLKPDELYKKIAPSVVYILNLDEMKAVDETTAGG